MKDHVDNNRKQYSELIERQKELQCLYKVKAILKEEHFALGDILLKIIAEIPYGYQFPEICQAVIHIGDEEYCLPGHKCSEIMQTAKIRLHDEEIGEIRVCYSQPVNTDSGEIFLSEEQTLIETIAESISQYITIQHFREKMKEDRNFSENLKIPQGLGKWLIDMKINKNQTRDLLTTKIHFRKGDLILKQGAHASYFVLLTEGLIKAYLEDLNNRSFTFKIIRPYDFIGLSSMSGSSNYGFSASALVPSSGYLIRKEDFQSVVEKNPEFCLRIFDWYSRSFDLLYHKLDFLGNKQAFGRIADTLLYLWEEIFDRKIITKDIPRKIIAELSGMSNENGVRILSGLKAEGIIGISKQGIEIIKPDKLRTYKIVS